MHGLSRGVKVTIVVLGLAACSTERAAPPAPAPLPVETSASTASTPATSAMQATQATPAKSELGTPALAGQEGRDPFEGQPVVVVPAGPQKPFDIARRKSKRFGVEELKLVGIVSDSEKPRAMLVDPRGKGWVVTRGELIGRPEVLHDAQGDHTVSWRVDRIREGDVILVREDATHSVVPSSTRVLALRHDPVISDDADVDD